MGTAAAVLACPLLFASVPALGHWLRGELGNCYLNTVPRLTSKTMQLIEFGSPCERGFLNSRHSGSTCVLDLGSHRMSMNAPLLFELLVYPKCKFGYMLYPPGYSSPTRFVLQQFKLLRYYLGLHIASDRRAGKKEALCR